MSAYFSNGPAGGECLNLARAPIMLRVVIDPDGKIDALDQPEDSVRPGEAVHVYMLARASNVAFVDGVRGGRRHGWREVMSHYVHFAEPVPAEITNDNARWAAWCAAEEDRLRAMHEALIRGGT